MNKICSLSLIKLISFSINSECVGGTHSCFINFTVNDSSGHLSDEQLDILKIQIIQVFNFQFDNGNNVATERVQEALKTLLSGMCRCLHANDGQSSL